MGRIANRGICRKCQKSRKLAAAGPTFEHLDGLCRGCLGEAIRDDIAHRQKWRCQKVCSFCLEICGLKKRHRKERAAGGGGKLETVHRCREHGIQTETSNRGKKSADEIEFSQIASLE